MSRIPHLPPRCPPPIRVKEDEMPDLIRFPSLGTILEEQPSWFEELLTDSDVNSKETLHRRSASDSAAILEVSAELQCPISNSSEESEICGGFGGNCVYGPNSPRQKSSLSNSEVSALMESIPPNKLQYVTVDVPSCETMKQADQNGEYQISAGDLDPEKAARRRSGQRSRVRKLQYIAELERTVDVYQTIGAELAAGVASLFQQRLVLSVENKKLRQQIARLRQEKVIKDGEYQSLKKEAERLKAIYGCHRRSKSAVSLFDTESIDANPSGAAWQMLDFGKLNLDGNPVAPLRLMT
ncbi:uncharacterized protein A4U43_C09F1290 [Asparagus officinalis]|uniref:BZIP domain-containing protein n=1 Tax=Asparagus officinalis TaxID=4686 RepID=A0A5P1E7Q9_ASPOF|nr:basic leucine zipper 34 isoform X2 [Asparagus officinalis]ONK57515.1 uncharacterized protein A4U43_C09F1290 [Asparagus officinalis]